MVDELYEDADLIAEKTITDDKRYDIFAKLSEEFSGLEEVMQNEDLEILPLTQEQRQLIDKINIATTKVFQKYNISAHATEDSVQIYHINKARILYEDEDTGEELEDFVEYEDLDDNIPHSFIDPNTSLIYLRDVDLLNERGEIDLKKIGIVYPHELSHRYGIPHEEMTDDESVRNRKTGIYLSSFYEKGESGWRVMNWLDEAATIHIAAEIKYEAGLSESPEPKLEDWSDPPDEDMIRNFDSLAENLGRYLKNDAHSVDRQTIEMLIKPSGFDLKECDLQTMKRFLVEAHVNRNLHTGLVYLLYSAYSQVSTQDRRYETVWDEIMDDIGLFGISFESDTYRLE